MFLGHSSSFIKNLKQLKRNLDTYRNKPQSMDRKAQYCWNINYPQINKNFNANLVKTEHGFSEYLTSLPT